MRIILVGATSAIATEVARQYALEDRVEFVLIGRNEELLGTLARDLRVRSAHANCTVVATALDNPKIIAQVVQEVTHVQSADIVLIAQGSLPSQEKCQADIEEAASELYLNAISPVLWAESFVEPMKNSGGGVIAVIGSVAGDRGRKSNYVYGAAKSLVDTYMHGLQHRLAGTNVTPLLIKPGPVNTPMTAHLRGTIPGMASVEEVAADIRKAILKRQQVIYTPKKWALIMKIIRALPGPIFNKMDL